jgi:hypothetical protein
MLEQMLEPGKKLVIQSLQFGTCVHQTQDGATALARRLPGAFLGPLAKSMPIHYSVAMSAGK